MKKLGFNRIILCCVLLLMYLLFCLLSNNFAGLPRILSALNYAYFLGFLSLGVTFVIATGGIDFSIGPVMFCAALISGYCLTSYGVPVALSLVISILVGMLFGIFNGYLVAYWSVPPFIVSMASMNIAKGVASVFTKTQSVSWPQGTTEQGWFRNLVKVGNFPVGLIIFLLFAVVCSVILNKTKAGRYILSLGSNKEAVRLSGVNIKKWEMLAYVICGILVGIAAIFFVAAYTTVQPGYGDQYNNEAIAGCVMGGTSMAGGVGTIGGTIVGAFVIGVINDGMTMCGVTEFWQKIIRGLVIIIAVIIDQVQRNLQAKMALQARNENK